ncbi:MAG: peptidoglycan DD-metalloendopeptidase family protein [Acidobacteria bacterium]|nr:peptidoglycan DD-metalloendopeptidase family protein [Acidobacteriota bacterium]
MADLRQKVDALDANLDRLGQHLAEIKNQSSKLSDEIVGLELERAIISQKRERAETQLQIANQEMTRIDAQREDLAAQRLAQETDLANRLRSLYKQGRFRYLQLLLRQSSLDDWLTTLHYNQVLAKRDHRAISEYRATVNQLEIVQESLEKTRQLAESQRQELQTQEDALNDVLRKRNQAWARIKKEQSSKRRMLEELALEKEELELMIQKLTSDNADPLAFALPITRYKGRLNWPLEGKLVSRFGVFQDPEFKTKRMQNGIDIAVRRGASVRSIYAGKVIFADWFKSYGNLVIVDHGHNITSFYAHNDTLQVTKGDIVERGQVIALAGDTGSLEGTFLHFEIRNQGKPEDPLQWIER